jgi:hypothetical protein
MFRNIGLNRVSALVMIMMLLFSFQSKVDDSIDNFFVLLSVLLCFKNSCSSFLLGFNVPRFSLSVLHTIDLP